MTPIYVTFLNGPDIEALDITDTEILAAIGRGDFAPLLAWLRPSVHGHGSRLSTRELLIHATGRPLDPAVFKRHLETRYLS